MSLALALVFTLAARTGTGDPAEIFRDKEPDQDLVLHGQLRLRSALYNNLDLDRGASPTSGSPLFADGVNLGNDARVRFNPSFFLGDELRLFADVDLLAASLGPAADGVPFEVKSEAAAAVNLFDVRAVGVDWLLPLGVLSFGRMPSHFALGIAANDGAALDDDGGDRADRIALVMPIFGHIVAGAVDALDAKTRPSVGEQAATIGIMKWRAPWEVEMVRKAGRTIFDYGAAVSWEWESKDSPGLWALVQNDPKVVRRDAHLLVADLWLRLVVDRFRLEGEGFISDLEIQNPSQIPGVIVRQPVNGNPGAFAVIGEMRLADDADAKGRGTLLQLETGAASADPAPGFPFTTPTPPAFSGSVPGDVFGAQVDLKHGGDARFDSARINPLHRIDLILWRTLLGGVSEAAYGRAHIEGSPLDGIRLDANLVYSHALSADSAPGGAGPLGVELDVGAEGTLALFGAGETSLRIDAGNLVPLGGLGVRGGNPTSLASWAQMVLVRVGYAL